MTAGIPNGIGGLPVCPRCDDTGWVIGHEYECYEDGDCVCDGVQELCECVRPLREVAAELDEAGL